MKTISAFFVIFMLASTASAQTCAEKIQAIKTRISFAEKYNNQAELHGLRTALKQAQENCTDAGLKAKAEEKIRDAEEDAAEARRELDEAVAKNKSPEKIRKKQRELEEEQKELEETLKAYR